MELLAYTLLTTFTILSVLVLVVSFAGTAVVFWTKEKGDNIEFDAKAFFFSFVVPIVYLISLAFAYYDVLSLT